MELLLNLIWVAISAALGALLMKSSSRCGAAPETRVHSRSTAWICYLVLIALLLPAISMTDDLMAMAAPTDSEQIVRRYEVSVGGPHQANLQTALFHTERPSLAPLICVGNLEAPPAFQASYPPPRQYARDRAPPVAA